MNIILILLFMSDFWLGVVNLKLRKALKQRLMPVVWNPRIWSIFACQKMKKNR